MATSTTNLGLRKPGRDNYVSVVTDINNNMDTIDAAIGAVPSGANLQQEIAGKVDKVASPTNGNFAALDANGNIKDSGHKHSDYLTAHQDISGKADKVASATNGNFAGLDANGNLTDSGHKHSDYITEHQDISGKADRVSGATSGDLAALDSNGNLTDSGAKAADFALSSDVGTVPEGQTVQGEINALQNGKADAILESDSTEEAVKTIPDGANGMPMKIAVGIEPVQDLHGQEYPYPAGAGKNKLPTMSAYGGNPSVTVNADGSVLINGSNSGSSAVMFAISNDVEVAAGVEYILSGCPSGGGLNSYRIDVRKGSDTSDAGLDPELQTVVDIGSGATFTPTTTHNVRFAIRVAANATVSNKTFYPMLRLSSVSDATYAPYENKCPISGWSQVKISRTGVDEDGEYIGTTKQIVFPNPPGTVYSGMLTVNKDGTGTLVVDKASVDMGDYTYTYDSTYSRFITTADIANIINNTTRKIKAICSSYKCLYSDEGIASAHNGDFYFASKKLVFHDGSTTDPSVFKTSVAGQTVVYPIATPVTYTLTSEQVGKILSLNGENNIWADCGNVLSVEYSADTKAYIDNLFASLTNATGVSF